MDQAQLWTSTHCKKLFMCPKNLHNHLSWNVDSLNVNTVKKNDAPLTLISINFFRHEYMIFIWVLCIPTRKSLGVIVATLLFVKTILPWTSSMLEYRVSRYMYMYITHECRNGIVPPLKSDIYTLTILPLK